MTNAPRINIAAIGLGWVTTHRHLPTMTASGRYNIVGVIDRKPGRAKALSSKKRYPNWSESTVLSEIPWIGQVDAISIGTSPFSHFDLIRQALELGKHVITEKPFCMTVEEGETLVALAAERKRILAIVHNFQFASSTLKLLADIESGQYGQLRTIMATQFSNPRRRLPEWYEQLPLGLFYDESPHLLYLLRRLSGGALTMKSCSVFPSTMGHVTPATIQAMYSVKSAGRPDIPAQLLLNFETPVSEWQVFIAGDNYLGIVDVFRDIYVKLPNDGLHVTSTVFRTSLAATFHHWLQHVPRGIQHLLGNLRYGNDIVFQRFADAIATGTPPLGIGADDALAVLRLQHEIINRAAIG